MGVATALSWLGLPWSEAGVLLLPLGTVPALLWLPAATACPET